MGIINILDKSVSELIAAGEVIERPASVIKELIENSIDAGATKIKIEIKNGGVTYIKIADNGCGIHKDDVKKAFLRHATSKVEKQQDLNNILTLGFRGEALASICAVSKIELITRTADEVDGTRYLISANQEELFEDVGAPVGTTIIIRDLFFNVPARMKFLKKDSAEGSAVATIVEKLALSHPEISFSLQKEGQEKLFTFGDGELLSVIHCVLGKEVASKMIELKYEENTILITGYISDPANAKSNRSLQNFFVNSRYVKSKTCCAALEEAYKSFVTSGRFPSCVLNIKIPSSVIDINVHPAKLEVRFANEKMIYSLVYAAVKNCILSNLQMPTMNLKKNNNFNNKSDLMAGLSQPEDRLLQKQQANNNQNNNLKNNLLKTKLDDYLQNSLKPSNKINNLENFENSEIQSNSEYNKDTQYRIGSTDNFENFSSGRISFKNSSRNDLKDYKIIVNQIAETSERIQKTLYSDCPGQEISKENKNQIAQKNNDHPSQKLSDSNIDNMAEINEINIFNKFDDSKKQPAEMQMQLLDESQEKNKFIGEIFNSYIILEKDKEIVLIDKHAAHERIIYEKIKSGKLKNHRQILLSPQVVNLSTAEYQVATDNLQMFENMGFLVEDFGEKAIIVREIPLVLSDKNDEVLTQEVILEIINNIINYKNNLTPVVLEKIYYTFACKAAIKAGDKSNELELQELVEVLAKNSELTNCPHGRPISFVIKKKDIERQFLR